MDALEPYLNQCTKWIFGRRKHIVRQELRGNLQELALEYQLQGMTTTDSLEAAMRDFGNPKKLRSELMEVHTMPTLHKTATLASLIASTMLLAAISSAAPISTTSNAPLPNCSTINPDGAVNAAFNCAFGGSWLKLSELRRELEATGGAVVLQDQQIQIRFAGDSSIVRFSVKNPTPLTPSPEGMPSYTYHQFFSFEKDSETYINLALTVSYIVQQTTLPVRLEGWQNPKLRVGETELTLGTSESTFDGRFLYTNGLHESLLKKLPNRSLNTASLTLPSLQFYDTSAQSQARYLYEPHRIALAANTDGIYAVVSQNTVGFNKGIFVYTIAQSQQGIVETYLPSRKVNFGNLFESITGSANPLEQNVLLLKLSGELNGNPYQIVQPRASSSTAIAR